MSDNSASRQQSPEMVTGDDVEQEFYTALRAAGASAEEAKSCLQAAVPPAASPPLLC